MSVLHINKDNFRQEVLQSDKPVLVDLWADWCGPCRRMGPVLEEVAAERPDIKVCKINVEEEPELAAAFHVSSIPLLVVVKNGEVVNQSLGAIPKRRVLELL